MFVFSDIAEYGRWREVNKSIERLEGASKDPNKKAEKFIDIFSDVYTTPINGQPKTLPAFALVDVFERSFGFLRKEVKPEIKKEIVNLQLRLLTERDIPQEAHNAMKGIWGFYADAEKRQRSEDIDDLEVRKELLESVRLLRKYYDSNPELLKYLSKDIKTYFYLPEEESWKTAGEGLVDEIKYFARLYENEDYKPLKIEQKDIWEHRIAKQQKGESGKGPEERVLPPHERLYSFERNRIPTFLTITERRAGVYLTEDDEVLKRERSRYIVCRELPVALIDYFRNRALKLRYSEEYRGATDTVKQSLRRELVGSFIDDVLNENSELIKSITEEGLISKDEKDSLRALEEKYKQVGGKNLYLGFRISFGEKKDEK